MTQTLTRNSAPAAHETATRPLRILHLADALFEEKPGGSRQLARELMREQTRMGHDVTLLVARQIDGAPGDWREPDRGRILQYARGGSPAEWVKGGEAACARLLAEAEQSGAPFDIAHTHFAWASVGPLKALQKNGVAHVRTFHGPWDAEGWVEDRRAAGKNPIQLLKALAKRKMRFDVERDNLRASRAITTLSSVFASETERYGVGKERVTIIPGGVNRERFTVDASDPGARSAARARVGLPEEAFPLLLSVRRLAPRMGLENLVAAFPAVRQAFPKARLVIGGKGPMQEALQAQAAALGVADAVTLAGFIPDDQVVDYYRAADLFVLPTTALEGFGLVTVEALASGTPVVATPVGAIPEVLGPLEKRLLAGGTDAAALSAAILGFCRERQTPGGWSAELTAKRLTQYVDERYTWQRHAAAVEQLYRQALRGL